VTHALHSSAVVGLPPRALPLSLRAGAHFFDDREKTAAVSSRLARIRSQREERQAAGMLYEDRQAVMRRQLDWVKRAQSYGVENQKNCRPRQAEDPSSTTGERSWLERELRLAESTSDARLHSRV
jgi:hypothetical protein